MLKQQDLQTFVSEAYFHIRSLRIGWSAVHLQSTILVGFLMPISQILFCILIKGIDETPLGIFSAGL